MPAQTNMPRSMPASTRASAATASMPMAAVAGTDSRRTSALGDITNVMTRAPSVTSSPGQTGVGPCCGGLRPLPSKLSGLGSLGLGRSGRLSSTGAQSKAQTQIGAQRKAQPLPERAQPAEPLDGVLNLAGNRTSLGSAGTSAAASAPAAASRQTRHKGVCLEDVGIDVADAENPQLVAEYALDIYSHISECERAMMPKLDYMQHQPEINPKMRSILMDWLVEVQIKYKLRPETLHLAVRTIDRFLSARETPRKRLQLVGVAGMMIAAKYEEIYPPEIKEFVKIADNAFTKDDLLNMEISMLTALEFNLCAPTVVHFQETFQRMNQSNELQRHLLAYVVELSICDYKMLRYPPSHVAAAAILLANKLMKVQPTWPPAMTKQVGHEHVQIRECAKELYGLFESAEGDSLQAVRRKYSGAHYQSVAKKVF